MMYDLKFSIQASPDRNGRIYDELLFRKMVNQHMQESLPDNYKKLNIEIEEVDC